MFEYEETMDDLDRIIHDLTNKIQFLLDECVDTPEGRFCFPDGEIWVCEPTTPNKAGL